MESISSSVFKDALDIQASSAATLIAGGPPLQPPAAPQGGDDAARAAGLQAQGIGQKVDTTC